MNHAVGTYCHDRQIGAVFGARDCERDRGLLHKRSQETLDRRGLTQSSCSRLWLDRWPMFQTNFQTNVIIFGTNLITGKRNRVSVVESAAVVLRVEEASWAVCNLLAVFGLVL